VIFTLVANRSSDFVSFDSTPVFLLHSVTRFSLAHNYKHTHVLQFITLNHTL